MDEAITLGLPPCGLPYSSPAAAWPAMGLATFLVAACPDISSTNLYTYCGLAHCSALGWWDSPQRRANTEAGVMTDVYDSPLWQLFTKDPQMQAQGQCATHPELDSSGTGLNLAFVGCTDGASPHERSNYSLNP